MHLVGNTGLLGIFIGALQQHGIQIDAETAGTAFARGSNDDAAVTGAEIDDKVVLGDAGDPQHLINNLLRCRHIRTATQVHISRVHHSRAHQQRCERAPDKIN